MTDHLSARLPAGTLERIDRAGNGDRQQGARAVIAAGLETTMSDTDTPTGQGPAPFGVRLDAATLARLDAYAARIDRKRGGAAARVIAAGLDALEGLPVRAPERWSAKGTANAAALDVDAIADAVADRVVPAMADAVAYGVALKPEKQQALSVEEFSLFDVR
jgi:hypothetical protein